MAKMEKAPPTQTEQQRKKMQLSFEELIQLHEQQRQQLQVYENYRGTIASSIAETNAVIQALTEIKSLKKGDSIVMSIGAGIFLDVQLTSNNKSKMMITENSLKEYSIADAIIKLEARKKNAEKQAENVLKEEQTLVQNIQGLESIIQKIQQDKMKRGQVPSGPAVIS